MRVAVVGGVNSTQLLTEKLREHGFVDVKVWGYAPDDVSQVSGWSDLSKVCAQLDFPYQSFVRIADCVDELRLFCPDVIFAVGLSQLIPEEILEVPTIGCIGFHPTALPKGRGRAPIAWILLDNVPGAASFFTIRKGVDDGPILAQEAFDVIADDTASTIEKKLLLAEARALDRLLPSLISGLWVAVEQDHAQATWYGRRSPEDGWIDWKGSADAIERLVRASSKPHPGAFTHWQDAVVTIWAAEMFFRAEKGVVGRVLSVEADQSFVVQCGDGLIKVTQWTATNNWSPRVGQKLGYYADAEIRRLRSECEGLRQRVGKLEEMVTRMIGNPKS